MTAAAADFLTTQAGAPDEVLTALKGFPLAAATKVFASSIVGVDASGNAGPISATFLTVVGRSEHKVDNSAGAAGDLPVLVRRGSFAGYAVSGSAITKASLGAAVYAVDDKTLSLDSSGGTRPYAGYVDQVIDGVVYYAIGVGIAVPSSSIVNATTSAAGLMPAPDKKFLDSVHAAKGTDLADADATIQIGDGTWHVLPAATLSASRALTLGTTGAIAGDQTTVTRLDATAHTFAVINGGGGAGTLVTFPNSKIGFARFQFDGTDWALREVGSL